MIKKAILILFLSVFMVCLTVYKSEADDETEPLPCSMICLIATPEKYHGKKILTEGFVVIEFENDALYFSELDALNRLSRNGIWLSFKTTEQVENYQHLSGKYALVEGVFDSRKKGHLSLFSGEIRDISRILEK